MRARSSPDTHGSYPSRGGRRRRGSTRERLLECRCTCSTVCSRCIRLRRLWHLRCSTALSATALSCRGRRSWCRCWRCWRCWRCCVAATVLFYSATALLCRGASWRGEAPRRALRVVAWFTTLCQVEAAGDEASACSGGVRRRIHNATEKGPQPGGVCGRPRTNRPLLAVREDGGVYSPSLSSRAVRLPPTPCRVCFRPSL